MPTNPPATITALKPLPTDPSRISIRVGRKKVATLPYEQVREQGLGIGVAWTDELAERVAEVAASEQTYHDALRMLRRRALGTEELRGKLRQKRHDGAHIDAAIARIAAAGYLDDRAYAESLVQRELRRKPAGPRLLKTKLQQKRLPRDLIEDVVSQIDGDTDHTTAARELAEKKLATATLQKADSATRYRRLSGHLARRGFESDTIRRVLAAVLNNADEDDAF